MNYAPVGYLDEMDRPVICSMSANKIEFCRMAGLTILYVEVV